MPVRKALEEVDVHLAALGTDRTLDELDRELPVELEVLLQEHEGRRHRLKRQDSASGTDPVGHHEREPAEIGADVDGEVARPEELADDRRLRGLELAQREDLGVGPVVGREEEGAAVRVPGDERGQAGRDQSRRRVEQRAPDRSRTSREEPAQEPKAGRQRRSVGLGELRGRHYPGTLLKATRTKRTTSRRRGRTAP